MNGGNNGTPNGNHVSWTQMNQYANPNPRFPPQVQAPDGGMAGHSPVGQPPLEPPGGMAGHSPVAPPPAMQPNHQPMNSDPLLFLSTVAEANANRVIAHANAAMEEMVRKIGAVEPLWKFKDSLGTEALNGAEYIRRFRALDTTISESIKCHQDAMGITNETGDWHPNSYMSFRTEASRCGAYFDINGSKLSELIIDFNSWSSIFSGILSKPVLVRIIQTKPGESKNDSIQVVSTGYQMANPLVPVKECQFLRYRKHLAPMLWGIVEVSMDNLFSHPVVEARRRPSGCIIIELPNGWSKVRWVEHMEVRNAFVDPIFQHFVYSGLAFSAYRWLATLLEFWNWLPAILLRKDAYAIGPQADMITKRGLQGLLSLTRKMKKVFTDNISAASDNKWLSMPGPRQENIRLMTKNIKLPNGTNQTTMAFNSTYLLSSAPHHVFDYLQDPYSRCDWDVFSFHHEIQGLTQIILNDIPADNRILIIHSKSSILQKEIAYLQESYTDITGLYVVSAPISVKDMVGVLNGTADPNTVFILPSGFALYPDQPKMIKRDQGGDCGTIVTMAYHLVDDKCTEHFVMPEALDVVRKIVEEASASIEAVVAPIDDEEEDLDEEDEDEDEDEDDGDDDPDDDDDDPDNVDDDMYDSESDTSTIG